MNITVTTITEENEGYQPRPSENGVEIKEVSARWPVLSKRQRT